MNGKGLEGPKLLTAITPGETVQGFLILNPPFFLNFMQ